MVKKRTNAEFIALADVVHNNRYNYGDTNYNDAKSKVNIKCLVHGIFEQTPDKHLRGQGCPKCRKNAQLTQDDFIRRANEAHGEGTYDYSLVHFISVDKKVVIKCANHGAFNQRADVHLNGNGCPTCGNVKRITQAEFIEEAIKRHGDRYIYDAVNFCNKKTSVIIKCLLHGAFEQTPRKHLMGRGCRICAIEINANRKQLTIEEFIRRATMKHGKRYDYSRSIYNGYDNKIVIKCHQHGRFEQTVSSHLSGKGCIQCGGKYQSNTEEFIIKANKVHNNQFDYSSVVYTTAIADVIIICSNGHKFLQSPNAHLSGNGCSQCPTNGFSKMQIKWLTFLEELYKIDIQHMGKEPYKEYRIASTRWKADGYCENTNTIYEFHGDYWHGNPARYDPEIVNTICNHTMKSLYAKTITRDAQIKELGYNLVVMWESDWVNLNKAIRFIQRKFKSYHP